MEMLFVVSTEEGSRLLMPLARACRRRERSFAAFFTHHGVIGLRSAELVDALAGARAVACKESWNRFVATLPCPVELGSQTTLSALAKQAPRMVSL